MLMPSIVPNITSVSVERIDYDEIIATTESDVVSGRWYTLEETEAFGREVVARLQRARQEDA
jgi:hypothetical protein